ncbi:uncharacterized protein VTP21DRAFT_10654 [Calcarisporiella thermophila]|uniref:uncharacterized protein n=1 Tax=Calcarisporiella thermophila TaxID=911321 RepID=UPI00374345B1
MVCIPHEKIGEAYDTIIRSHGKCLIFVPPDVDALCACRILVTLFKSDVIEYEIVPVANYTDAKTRSKIINQHVKTIFMINCGGMMDIAEDFELSPDINVIIMDSHRPLNLHNIFGSNQILVLDDGEIETQLQDVREAYESIEFEESEESEMEEDEASEESDAENREVLNDENNENLVPKKRRKSPEKNSLPRKSRRVSRESREKHRAIIHRYYNNGTWFGNSASAQAYSISTSISKTTNDQLWLAIVGVTSQYLSGFIDLESYLLEVDGFRDEVSRLNFDKDSDIFSAKGPDDHGIRFQEELNIVAYRHWSVYNSLFYSNYVATKLRIWNESGQKRLRNMLAKMGIPLREVQEDYNDMRREFKRTLREKLEEVAPRYDLEHIFYPSFYRTFGYKGVFAAGDIVHSLTGLLASTSSEVEWGLGADDNRDGGGGGSGGKLVHHHADRWLENFYSAFDALDTHQNNSLNILVKGIAIFKQLQKSIAQEANATMKRRGFSKQPKGHDKPRFRLAVLQDGANLGLCVRPLVLERIGLYISEAIREAGSSKHLPLLIAAYNQVKDTYLLVGIYGGYQYGATRRNRFGMAFQEAARVAGISGRFDNFEPWIIEIQKGDFDVFISALGRFVPETRENEFPSLARPSRTSSLLSTSSFTSHQGGPSRKENSRSNGELLPAIDAARRSGIVVTSSLFKNREVEMTKKLTSSIKNAIISSSSSSNVGAARGGASKLKRKGEEPKRATGDRQTEVLVGAKRAGGQTTPGKRKQRGETMGHRPDTTPTRRGRGMLGRRRADPSDSPVRASTPPPPTTPTDIPHTPQRPTPTLAVPQTPLAHSRTPGMGNGAGGGFSDGEEDLVVQETPKKVDGRFKDFV